MYDLADAIPAGESLLIGGDLSGHVGSHSDCYEGVHRGIGYGQRNAEGESILEFGLAQDMVVCNTFFKKQDSHLIFESGNSRSQIHFIMSRSCDRRTVSNVKIITSASYSRLRSGFAQET